MADWGALKTALNKVLDPETGQGLLDSGKIKGLDVSDEGKASLVIEVSAALAPSFEPVRQDAEAAALGVKGVTSAQAILTAEAAPAASKAAPKPQEVSNGKPKLPGVRHILAVASGKGGVGKSTLALNLALLLKAQGLKVGLLDADIYGPSVPRLTGLEGRRPLADPQNRAIPLDAFGLQVLSIGFMLKDPRTAMIWRGPMVQQALTQLLKQAAWGPSETSPQPLDVLVIDMPPGTGDIHISLAQQVAIDGAVVISTPQDLALLDARKGLSLFEKVQVPVLGLIENMAGFTCTNCGTNHAIFGSGGVADEADTLGLPFLGSVPLTMALREASDGGAPLPLRDTDDPAVAALGEIAVKVWQSLTSGQVNRTVPVFEMRD